MGDVLHNISSLRNRLSTSSLLTLFLTLMLVVGFVVVRFTAISDVRVPVMVGEAHFDAEVARSEQARQQGLSGRAGLSESEAMLFIMPEAGFHGFWMKDMNFAIDIFWIYKGRVVDIKHAVLPPRAGEELTVYYPHYPADMVLETVAGAALAYGIGVGDTVTFPSPQQELTAKPE